MVCGFDFKCGYVGATHVRVWPGVPQLVAKASMDAYDEDHAPCARGVSSEFVCISTLWRPWSAPLEQRHMVRRPEGGEGKDGCHEGDIEECGVVGGGR